MTADTHECPVGRCSRRVPYQQLMCREHWRMVPNRLRWPVYQTWRNGQGAGTKPHIDAMREAVAAVEAQLPATLL